MLSWQLVHPKQKILKNNNTQPIMNSQFIPTRNKLATIKTEETDKVSQMATKKENGFFNIIITFLIFFPNCNTHKNKCQHQKRICAKKKTTQQTSSLSKSHFYLVNYVSAK